MWDQDWKCSKLKMKKGKGQIKSSSQSGSELENLEGKFEGILQTANLLYKKQPKVPGYPGWCVEQSLVEQYSVEQLSLLEN